MRKFKVNTDTKPKEPTKEQMARYKDFATISHQYDRIAKRPKKPLYRDPKLFLLLLILGLVMLLIFLEG
ncbi:MAG: hypothetical protein HYZ43_15250 [Flavobacteriia bacterium]|jgi:hypothetical protein|nr:hypothetical protein [Flavobacteriia bacterium]MDH4472383.1 hypothetical protein [Fluviicola sp.]